MGLRAECNDDAWQAYSPHRLRALLSGPCRELCRPELWTTNVRSNLDTATLREGPGSIRWQFRRVAASRQSGLRLRGQQRQLLSEPALLRRLHAGRMEGSVTSYVDIGPE